MDQFEQYDDLTVLFTSHDVHNPRITARMVIRHWPDIAVIMDPVRYAIAPAAAELQAAGMITGTEADRVAPTRQCTHDWATCQCPACVYYRAINVHGEMNPDGTFPSLPGDALEPGAVIISIASSAGRFSAVKEPGSDTYVVEDDNDAMIARNLSLLQVLALADVVDDSAAELSHLPGECRILHHADNPKQHSVERWNGKEWKEIAGRVALSIARGIYEKRMAEAFPEMPGGSYVERTLRAGLETIGKVASSPNAAWNDISTIVRDTLNEAKSND